MLNLRMVETLSDLQNLVAQTILVQDKPFSVDEIRDEVLEHQLFNQFCTVDELHNNVQDMIITLLRSHQIIIWCGDKYSVN